ncbi:hypothetical protein GCM10028806_01340 [Spirosoma terrae]|uniref:Uncharacterized protein n=1 Tax=Spirosoma terrae TaxID=1968276 RepID=A0A6L9LAS0_9BACT|nr:hypothetical protein [Spirosoma terrae]NDU97606.1 hypothetical protein [Spirosoma terrae]
MITQDQHQASLIEQTVTMFDGAITETTAVDGLFIIDQWLNRLDLTGDEDTDDIADTLERLRAEVHVALHSKQPDNQRIATILQDLIEQTQKVASLAEASAEQQELAQLIAMLQHLHRQANQTID